MNLRLRLVSSLTYVGAGAAALVVALFFSFHFLAHAQPNADAPPPPPPPSATVPSAPLSPPPVVSPKSAQPSMPAAPSAPPTSAAPPPPGAPTAAAANDSKGQPIAGEVTFLEPYVFDLREGRRNPFQPPSAADGSTPNITLPGSPLERYELDEIRLVGIMWDVRNPKAMFIDPQGEVHTLGRDDRIGRKHGYIAAIREGEVVVVEASNFNGESAFATRILRLEREKK
jgi:type IV pilus assembly protein PilP